MSPTLNATTEVPVSASTPAAGANPLPTTPDQTPKVHTGLSRARRSVSSPRSAEAARALHLRSPATRAPPASKPGEWTSIMDVSLPPTRSSKQTRTACWMS